MSHHIIQVSRETFPDPSKASCRTKIQNNAFVATIRTMIVGFRLVSRKYHIGPFKHWLNKKSCPRKALAKSAMAYCDALRLCHCFVANGATQAPTFMNCSHEKLLLIQQSDADALSQQIFCDVREITVRPIKSLVGEVHSGNPAFRIPSTYRATSSARRQGARAATLERRRVGSR
jgi:hypothetical protein